MLADKKKRKKFSPNPQGNIWFTDKSKFGQKLLEKMGWKEGQGLGAQNQGISERIKVPYRLNSCAGFGFKEQEDSLVQQKEFVTLLSSMNNGTPVETIDNSNVSSLENKSKKSRARVHYHKFTRGKDLSRYSSKDLVGIFGIQGTVNEEVCDNENNGTFDSQNHFNEVSQENNQQDGSESEDPDSKKIQKQKSKKTKNRDERSLEEEGNSYEDGLEQEDTVSHKKKSKKNKKKKRKLKDLDETSLEITDTDIVCESQQENADDGTLQTGIANKSGKRLKTTESENRLSNMSSEEPNENIQLTNGIANGEISSLEKEPNRESFLNENNGTFDSQNQFNEVSQENSQQNGSDSEKIQKQKSKKSKSRGKVDERSLGKTSEKLNTSKEEDGNSYEDGLEQEDTVSHKNKSKKKKRKLKDLDETSLEITNTDIVCERQQVTVDDDTLQTSGIRLTNKSGKRLKTGESENLLSNMNSEEPNENVQLTNGIANGEISSLEKEPNRESFLNENNGTFDSQNQFNEVSHENSQQNGSESEYPDSEKIKKQKSKKSKSRGKVDERSLGKTSEKLNTSKEEEGNSHEDGLEQEDTVSHKNKSKKKKRKLKDFDETSLEITNTDIVCERQVIADDDTLQTSATGLTNKSGKRLKTSESENILSNMNSEEPNENVQLTNGIANGEISSLEKEPNREFFLNREKYRYSNKRNMKPNESGFKGSNLPKIVGYACT